MVSWYRKAVLLLVSFEITCFDGVKILICSVLWLMEDWRQLDGLQHPSGLLRMQYRCVRSSFLILSLQVLVLWPEDLILLLLAFLGRLRGIGNPWKQKHWASMRANNRSLLFSFHLFPLRLYSMEVFKAVNSSDGDFSELELSLMIVNIIFYTLILSPWSGLVGRLLVVAHSLDRASPSFGSPSVWVNSCCWLEFLIYSTDSLPKKKWKIYVLLREIDVWDKNMHPSRELHGISYPRSWYPVFWWSNQMPDPHCRTFLKVVKSTKI